jgi:TolA-binding protein
MRVILTSLLAGLFICISVVGLSEITVTYKNGESSIDMLGSGEWQEAALDMELKEESIIKTEKEALLEIAIDGAQIVVGESTTIKISEIRANLTEKKNMGWLSNMQSVFSKKIREGDDQTQSTLAGVRGGMDDKEELPWVDDMEDFEEEKTPETLFNEGKELYMEGKYSQAFSIFKDLIEDKRLAYLQEEIAFYLGSTMFNRLQYKESLPYLEMSINDHETYYYEHALMTLAFARFFVMDYRNAIVSFNTYLDDFSEGDFIPIALLMLGKSHKVLGENKKALGYFNVIVNEYKDSEVYNNAVNEMKEL